MGPDVVPEKSLQRELLAAIRTGEMQLAGRELSFAVVVELGAVGEQPAAVGTAHAPLLGVGP